MDYRGLVPLFTVDYRGLPRTTVDYRRLPRTGSTFHCGLPRTTADYRGLPRTTPDYPGLVPLFTVDYRGLPWTTADYRGLPRTTPDWCHFSLWTTADYRGLPRAISSTISVVRRNRLRNCRLSSYLERTSTRGKYRYFARGLRRRVGRPALSDSITRSRKTYTNQNGRGFTLFARYTRGFSGTFKFY